MRERIKRIVEMIAELISSDEVLHNEGKVSVVVEDKGNYEYKIREALAIDGVCVTIAVVSFRRVDKSPLMRGDLEMQISCFEHPDLNRSDDIGNMTAQNVMTHIADNYHYRNIDNGAGPLIFSDFSRDDTDEVNIVRGNFRIQLN